MKCPYCEKEIPIEEIINKTKKLSPKIVMEKNKEYELPEELIDIWDEFTAAVAARQDAVKSFFKFQLRNAIYIGKIAEKKRRLFWRKVRELYPELPAKIILNTEKMIIIVPYDYPKN